MRERRISEQEIEQALSAIDMETPGKTSDRINLWGETSGGRRLRMTVYKNKRDFVISVIAPDEA